jgi:hypothetical protein
LRSVHAWEACSGVVPGSNAKKKEMNTSKWQALAAIVGEDDLFTVTA